MCSKCALESRKVGLQSLDKLTDRQSSSTRSFVGVAFHVAEPHALNISFHSSIINIFIFHTKVRSKWTKVRLKWTIFRYENFTKKLINVLNIIINIIINYHRYVRIFHKQGQSQFIIVACQ